MIQGNFGEKGQLFFEIEFISDDGLNLPVDRCHIGYRFHRFYSN